MSTLVGTREINGKEVEIHASHHGAWSIRLVGVEGSAGHLATDTDSLDKAINKARLAIKKQEVEVAVPFKTLDGKQGIARGRHAKSRDKLLVTIGGKKESFSSYGRVLKHDTPKEVIEHLKELDDEETRIGREKREIMTKWSLKLDTAVDTAVREAAEAA